MNTKKEIQDALSEYDKVNDKVRSLIYKYLDSCYKKFAEEDNVWLSMSEFEDMQICEINGEDGVITNNEGVDYDYRDFETSRLIELYDSISKFI